MVSSTSLPGCYFFGLSLDKKRNLDNIPIPLEGEMAKSKRTISFLLPPYGYPPNAWREAIHRRAVQAARLRGVRLKDFKRESAVAVDVTVRSAVIRKTSPPKNRLGDGGRVTIRSLRS